MACDHSVGCCRVVVGFVCGSQQAVWWMPPPDPTPKKIVWELTPDLQHAIRKGESMLSDLVSTVLRALLLVLCTSRSAA